MFVFLVFEHCKNQDTKSSEVNKCFGVRVNCLFITFFVFGFWSLLATNIQNYKNISNLCLHFAKQGGEDGKKWKENHAAKVTKIPKTKRRKYHNMG